MPKRSNPIQVRIVSVIVGIVCGFLIVRDFYPKWLQSRLVTAVAKDDETGVKAALSLGADPNGLAADPFGARVGEQRTMLTYSVRQNREGIVKALLNAGAKIDDPDQRGCTPLLMAVLRRRTRLVDLLLNAGADPNRAGMGFDADGNDVNETPMEATTGLPLSLFSQNGAFRVTGSNRLIIYRLLREHGVVPTLCQATDKGDLGEVKALIRAGANVDAGDTRFLSPLHMAIQKGNRSIASQLLQAGAKRNGSDAKNSLPLVAALSNHDEKMVHLLLEYGAPIKNFKTSAEQIAFQAAVLADASLAEYQFLKSRGMPPDLSCAVRFHDIAVVKSLLKSGVNINRAQFKNKPPLLIGVETGKIDMVRLLLAAGADPDAEHPLIEACAQENVEIAAALLHAGADANAPCKLNRRLSFNMEWRNRVQRNRVQRNKEPKKQGYLLLERSDAYQTLVTPIRLAVENNNTALYHLLKKFGAHNDLLEAAAMGDLQGVVTLMQSGADVNRVNSLHDTPLTVALMRNRKAVVSYLLRHGANLDTYGSAGDSPLALAALYGGPEMVRILISHGARIDAVSKSGEPILMRVVYSDQIDSLRLLLARGADVNTRASTGLTALMRAVRANNVAMVQVLLEHGVDVNVRSESGETALSIALKQKVPVLIANLKRAGAVE